jgi:quercetin dioxygenase-like cupin family protein
MHATVPIVRADGEGDRRWFYGGGTHTWKVTAEETGGEFLLFEDALERGKMTPLHRHPDVDETVYVLEGEIVINIDGHEHRVGAGGVTVSPRGVPHAFAVVSETARLLFLQTPGSAQPFYWTASEPAAHDGPGPLDLDRVRDAAGQHLGTDLLGPPPFARF